VQCSLLLMTDRSRLGEGGREGGLEGVREGGVTKCMVPVLVAMVKRFCRCETGSMLLSSVKCELSSTLFF
jgi:hypothetical protein